MKKTDFVGPRLVKLTQLTKSSDAMVRLDAIKQIAALEDPRGVEPLIAALNDTEVAVTIAVAAALGELGDARAVEPLVSQLHQGDNTQNACIWALVRFKGAAVEPLLRVLDNPTHDGRVKKYQADEMVRGAVRALGCLGDDRALEPLRSVKVPFAMKEVNVALANLGDTAALQTILRSPREYKWSLGDLWGVRSVKPLLASLSSDEAVVRLAAAQIVLERSNVYLAETQQALLEQCRNAEYDLRWWVVVGALGRLRLSADADRQCLLRYLEDKDQYVRHAAVWALARLDDVRAPPGRPTSALWRWARAVRQLAWTWFTSSGQRCQRPC